MEEQAAHSGADEQEVETLSVEDFLKLLKLLKIKLPKDVLTAEAVAQSTQPNIISDATLIKQDLEMCVLQIAVIPRLACWRIEKVLQLKEQECFQDITKMIFFREVKSVKNKEPLMMRWGKYTQAGCGFQIKDTYQETTVRRTMTTKSSSHFPDHTEIQTVAKKCCNFYLREKNLTVADEDCKKNGKLEFGFLSGKPTFLLDIKSPPIKKIIIKCNSVTRHNPTNTGLRAEFNTSHSFYLQTQAFLYILKEKENMNENPVPVEAAMVVNSEDLFYCTEVGEDREKMEELNNTCKHEALPRFLAVLNLIFEKEKK